MKNLQRKGKWNLLSWWSQVKKKFSKKSNSNAAKAILKKKTKLLTLCQQRGCKFHKRPLLRSNKPKKTKEKSTKFSFLKSWLAKIVIALTLTGVFILLTRSENDWIIKVREIFSWVFGTFWWGMCGLLVGIFLYVLTKNKGKVVIGDNTSDFLKFCTNSNGMVFFGPVGSGKTAILAMLAHELPGDNKYASFPCGLPWMERAQVDFSAAPSQQLGVTETIFLDEINLLFKGNIVQDVREKQRFFMHFAALSRHQGTRIFANGQRLGQFSIEQREITTAVCQVERLQKLEEGLYVKCLIWESAGWSNSRTEREFIIFVPKKYLDTYNSYWLKGLKYLRDKQGYV